MSKPLRRVVEINRRKFMQKYGTLDLIMPYLKNCCGMDIERAIECKQDPANKDVVVFWQSLPNEMLCDLEGNVY